MNDAEILAATPDYISIGSMLKATPAMESGQRLIYLEASNEALDQQNEVVLQKALKDSADWFLRYGNLDIDHFSLIGKPNPAKGYAGIPDYQNYEIGRPLDVRFDGAKTFVKGEIYSGQGAAAEQANQFWESLTEIQPPARWYPSVGGSIMEKAVELDANTQARKTVIRKVRWSNIGFSKTPVNPAVPTVATVPIGVLVKSWGASGLDIAKALEAGYGTDSAQLSGGAALRKQSLHGNPIGYFELRNRLSEALHKGSLGKNPGIRDLIAHCTQKFGLSRDEAAECVERFMRDLKRGLKNRQAIRSGG
ncbi:hypothetical protein [Nitrosomonas sp. Nm58]|uniref:hypothetical protein n=1 Tax=Nitrosomonas sp. Nm58 TaxID=200126 RepID=UPI0008953FBD|nr:hypothetical protein [Nitrosomonas sp. Nm58]SDY38964.1 hypothetical protein SAMN05421754_100864 [Nitrosomonas sp. Nm58]